MTLNKIRSCAGFLCCLIGASLPAVSQSQIDKSLFEINNVVYTGGQIQFKVTNHSKPVLAYLVDVTWHLPNGHTRTHVFAKDLIFTFALPGKIIAPPGTHVGALKTGESITWNFYSPAPPGTNISVEPLAVVYTDNSVVGDEKLAASEIFAPRQEFVNVMSQHLNSLQQLTSLSPEDILSKLKDLKSQYDTRSSEDTRTAATTNGAPSTQANSDSLMRDRLSYEIDHLIKQISAGSVAPNAALSDYIDGIADQLSVYKSHAIPAY